VVLGGLEPEDAQLFDRIAFFCRAESTAARRVTLRDVYRVLGRVFSNEIE
jgi:hypothetical protein